MRKALLSAALFLSGFVTHDTASADSARTAEKPIRAPHQYNPFGTPGETSPELREALNMMSETGLVEGRRGSLHLFRWTGTPPKLTHLGLWAGKVTNHTLAATALMQDIEFLSLYETSVDDAGLACVQNFPKLRHLAITKIDRYQKPEFGAPQWSYPEIPSDHTRPRVTGKVLNVLLHSRTLESIDLTDCVVEPSHLAKLSEFPSLGSVSLPNPIDEDTVRHLQACKKLRNLTISNREVSTAEIERLSAWKGLRTLSITRSRLSNQTLESLSCLETLQELNLVDCGLDDNSLAHLKVASKLENLDLGRNSISGHGLRHLVKLNLKKLELTFNNITDATLHHLPTLQKLEHLTVSYNTGITDSGIQSGVLQGMKQLRQIQLRGLKKVTDKSFESMAQFGHLKNLSIRETATSPQCVERLKAAMPDTFVFK